MVNFQLQNIWQIKFELIDLKGEKIIEVDSERYNVTFTFKCKSLLLQFHINEWYNLMNFILYAHLITSAVEENKSYG